MKTKLIPILLVCCLAPRFVQAADATDPAGPGAAAVAAPVASFALSNKTANPLISLNFHHAALDAVLSYLSEAAGFVILPETEIKGAVDVWTSQPVSEEQAVALLDSVLRKNGYAAIQEGRNLSIVTLDEAKHRNIPTVSGGDPASIPKDDKIITQIIPVRSVSAAQAAKELAPLLSPTTELTADEAGNALIMTDARANIRRVAEIIKELDIFSASVNTVRVFPVKYGDAKTLAGVIKDLYPGQTSSSAATSQVGGGFPGGGPGGPGGPGGFPGGPGGPGGFGGGGGNQDRGGAADGNAQSRAPQVTAVAEEQSNSLIVSAPEEVLSSIAAVLRAVDQTVGEITQIRVFHFKNADPSEMAGLLASLFPDEGGSSGGGNQQPFGGGFPFGPGGGGPVADASGGASGRTQRLGRVNSVADQRTASLVVTAAKTLMPQIASLVQQLDSNPARKLKVRVVALQNADPEDMALLLGDLLPNSAKSSRGGSGQQGGALAQRSQTLLQQQLQNSSSSGFSTAASGGASGSTGAR